MKRVTVLQNDKMLLLTAIKIQQPVL